MLTWGEALLAADADRVGAVEALGLDETLFGRTPPLAHPELVHLHRDVHRGQPLDLVPGRRCGPHPVAARATRGVAPEHRLGRAGPLRRLSARLRRGAAPRRRGRRPVPCDPPRQQQHRRSATQSPELRPPRAEGRPPRRARRLLISAHERLSERGDAKLRGLLAAGDPHGEVRLAWHAKETLRGLYDIDCPQLAERYATELADDLADADCPPELRRLGRTLAHWHTPIVNWHHARVSNGPTEAINNLIKRVKRAAFGFRRFAHYRIRALLYAGKPNWNLLNSITPR